MRKPEITPDPDRHLSFHRKSGTLVLLVVCLILGDACGGSGPNNTLSTRPILYPEAKGFCPAVLVLPMAGLPVSTHGENVARRLAREGYAAQAISYGEKTSGSVLNDPSRLDRLKRLVSESLRNLQLQPGVDPKRLGMVSYSLGGAFATFLASGTEENGLRAVIIYYGVYQMPELMKTLRVPILAFQGDADSYRTFVDNACAMQRIAQQNQRQFDKDHCFPRQICKTLIAGPAVYSNRQTAPVSGTRAGAS